MSGFSILLWRDLRVIGNSAGRIVREPVRLFGWALWFIYILYCLFFRGHRHRIPFADVSIALDVAATIFLLVMSLAFLRGESPPLPFFESITEARFISTSRVEPWLVSMYFQLRNALRRFPSMAVFLAYLLTLTPPESHNIVRIALALTTTVGILLASRIFSLPREFSTGIGRWIFVAVGWLTLVTTFVSGLETLALLSPIPVPHIADLPMLHLGRVFLLAAAGSVPAAGCVYALLASAFVLGAVTTRGKYPELYALSVDGWEFRRRFVEGQRHAPFRDHSTTENAGIPPAILSGSAVALWLNWLMFRRSTPVWWIIVRPVVALALGYIAVRFAGDIVRVLKAFGVIIGLTIITTAVTDATRIGKELRQPLFWLTDRPLVARLGMFLLGWFWRSALDILVFFSGAAPAGNDLPTILIAASAALSLVWLQRCISAVSFAFLPSSADLGGPIFLARMLFTIVCSVPPGVAGVVAATMSNRPEIGVGIASALALVESAGLLAFAADRLYGRFDRILGY